MKISCLVHNCALPGFGAVHGLSLWIEACGKKLLFDSGADGLFLENAARLGIDVGQADFAVLSQGIPSFFYWLGTGFPGRENPCWHSAQFRTDDQALPLGAALLARSAELALGHFPR